eukprot:366157-Chlamydomonas_euryale.AAC.21
MGLSRIPWTIRNVLSTPELMRVQENERKRSGSGRAHLLWPRCSPHSQTPQKHTTRHHKSTHLGAVHTPRHHKSTRHTDAHLQHQLVMHAQQQPRPQPGAQKRRVHIHDRALDDVCARALFRIGHGRVEAWI